MVVLAFGCRSEAAPTTQTWVELPQLVHARADHTLTALRDGSLVVIGGSDGDDGLDTIELLAPNEPRWKVVGHLVQGRIEHTTTIMPDGKLLVIGGSSRRYDVNARLTSTEIFDPVSRTVTAGPSLVHARSGHTSVISASGEVWVFGGSDGAVTQEVERLPKGGTRFGDGPALHLASGSATGWPTLTGVVVVNAGILHTVAPIKRYGQWFKVGTKYLSPSVHDVGPGGTRAIANTLPAASDAFSAATGRGVVVLTRTPDDVLQTWRFDSTRGFTQTTTPPRGLAIQRLLAAGDAAVALGERTVARFRDSTWTVLSPPPEGLYGGAAVATTRVVVLAGGFDRNQTGAPVTGRVVRLSL